MFGFLQKWFGKKNQRTSHTPEDTCIYAVGDIHGRFDLLESLQQQILEDSQKRKCSRKLLLYVGDYIDRGFQSKEVITHLLEKPLEGFEIIHLKGNHEDALLTFLEEPEKAAAWLLWGGDATLQSYGVGLHDSKRKRRSPAELAADLRIKIPEQHLEFLQSLKLSHQEGDYVFVHAGLRPGVELANQQPEDMMMIREPFIFSKLAFPYTVVFGHTIFTEPFMENDRIGIDTGAYASGKLTAVVLEDSDVAFLNT